MKLRECATQHFSRVALVVLLALGACKDGPKASKDGAVLFATTCVQCHGQDGRGEPVMKDKLGVPDFTDPALHTRLSDEQIFQTIKDGPKSKKMPPWGGVFTDEQIHALVKHVRSFRPAH